MHGQVKIAKVVIGVGLLVGLFRIIGAYSQPISNILPVRDIQAPIAASTKGKPTSGRHVPYGRSEQSVRLSSHISIQPGQVACPARSC